MKQQFMQDVAFGLSQSPKQLSSKYFYDKTGDELFMQIMALPEYYLTRCEMEIFTQQTDVIINLLSLDAGRHFELIELGAGDGSKTQALLTRLLELSYQFDYIPIDISSNVLEHLKQHLLKSLPDLSIKTRHNDYFNSLKQLRQSSTPKVVLYLGSNLGNMNDKNATQFLSQLGENLHSGDQLLIGLDQLKAESIVLPAYSDSQGITSQFNLNLLHRINHELGANFNLTQFKHLAKYSETTGIAESYLQSLCEQQVLITELNQSFHFEQDETIRTEISRKYNKAILQAILKSTPFEITGELTDSKQYFSDYVLTRR